MSRYLCGLFRISQRRRQGQAVVEFALCALLLLAIILGIFDFGRAIYEYNTLANSAREGARFAVIRTHTDAQIRDRVRAMAYGTGLTNSDITITPLGSRAAESRVTIEVSHEFDPLTPFIASFMGEDGHIILRAESSMDVEY